MNIIGRELKSSIRGLFFWGLGIIFVVADGMIEYKGFQNSGNAIGSLLDAMPESVQIIFGMDHLDIGNVLGYYLVLFNYLVILCAVHAIMLGSSLIAKEERDKTAEFLLAKPISRNKIVLYKLAAGVIQLLMINLIVFGASIIGIVSYEEGHTDSLVMVMLGLLIVQSIFMAAGSAIAAVCRNPKLSIGLSAGVLLILYMASILMSLYEKLKFLRYVTPFEYINTHNLIEGEGFAGSLTGVACAVKAELLVITFREYRRRDMKL